MNYLQFLERKQHSVGNHGIEPTFIPDQMFDFQKYVSEYVIRKGRSACFLDTGLGKTIIELTTATNYARHTNKPVLIITPLAVAFQFIKEAKKFDIGDIEYSRGGKYKSKIVVCNYERLHFFNSNDFDCVILDESSILKNFDGAIKNQINSFIRKVKYRYLFTATPSPNDFVELGTSSEALGYMGYTDMLTRFFTNNEDTISPMNIGTEWILKGHAKENFFKWVSGWSVSMRKPSDLGFDDTRFILPELIVNHHPVKNETNMVVDGQVMLFNTIAKRLTEVRVENKMTIEPRCEMASKLIETHDISMVWCNYNHEGELLESLIPNSINISGSDSMEKKEEAILWFTGDKCICGSPYFGLNWQNKQKLKCGSQNTPEIEKISIEIQKKREIEEKSRVEILTEIKNTCANIIKITRTNLKGLTTKTKLETNSEENDIAKTKTLEQWLEKSPSSGEEETLINEEKEFLENMGLLQRTIIECLKNKKMGVRSVVVLYQVMEKRTTFTLTIATELTKLEGCFAQLVTLELENLETTPNYSNGLPCTCGHKSGVRRLISKPKIAAFGLNFQHCNHTVYFPTFSYEQYYQAIRRFWRFGQTRPVTVDLVYSDGQKRVLDSLIAKTKKANELFSKLNSNIHQDFKINIKEFSTPVNLPSWLKTN